MQQEHHEPMDTDPTEPAQTLPAEPPLPAPPPADTPPLETPPVKRRRRRRPYGRWTNPASPLQAARFARKASGKEVITAIRQLCAGHGGVACRIDVAKLSDYECGRRRPSTEHIEAMCRFYQMSPEALGLIKWRDEPAATSADLDADPGDCDHDDDPERLVDAWLRESAVSIATAVLTALARCPINLTEECHSGQPTSSQDDPPTTTPAPTGMRPPARQPDPVASAVGQPVDQDRLQDIQANAQEPQRDASDTADTPR